MTLIAVLVLSAAFAGLLLFLEARFLPAGFLAAAKNRDGLAGPIKRQIGGLAVVPALAIALALSAFLGGGDARFCLGLAAPAVWLSQVGYLDDRYDLAVLPRLAAQLAACVAALWAAWPMLGLFEGVLPDWLRAVLFAVILMWFVNLTNFMDGMDLLVVSALGLPLLWIALAALAGVADGRIGIAAAAAAGPLMAFGVANWPPARIILGDNGSLPLGLVGGTLSLCLAGSRAGLIADLPLAYFVADATTTLLVRLWRGDPVLKGHAEHAYQLARRAGWSATAVAGAIAMAVSVTAIAGAAALAAGRTPAAALACVFAVVCAITLIRKLGGPLSLRLRRLSR